MNMSVFGFERKSTFKEKTQQPNINKIRRKCQVETMNLTGVISDIEYILSFMLSNVQFHWDFQH